MRCVSVNALNEYIKKLFEYDDSLSSPLSVKGELSNVSLKNGSLYCTLKDDKSQIRVVMFGKSVSELDFTLENGLNVIVTGTVQVYAKDGSYRIIAQKIQMDGLGALFLKFEALKAKLKAEGLFDERHKKQLPEFPRTIGVVTSAVGAAVRDIIHVVQRRCPITEIIVYPAVVQGKDAEKSLISGLEYFEARGGIDVIIIGRGGGSFEDLFCFNSEALARRIFSCKIPVISAVGHQTDTVISDYVADKRAPTPSAAAELAVPNLSDYRQTLDLTTERITDGVKSFLMKKEYDLTKVLNSDGIKGVNSLLDEYIANAERTLVRVKNSVELSILERDNALNGVLGKIEALSPLAVLTRGFSMVKKEDKILSKVEQVQEGDIVSIRFSDGEAMAKIL